MASIQISDKNFDYLNALSDVAKFIEDGLSGGSKPGDILEALKFCGKAAEQKFDHMLECYAKANDKCFNPDPDRYR